MPNRQHSPTIVVVSPGYPPRVGGTEQVARYLSEGLAKLGHEVTVITSKTKGALPETVKNLHILRLRGRIVAHTTFMPNLLGTLLRVSKPHYYHVHYSGEAFISEIVALVAIIRRVPYVMHVHTDPSATGLMGLLLPFYKKTLLRWALRHAYLVIALTDEGKQDITHVYGLSADKVAVIPNGVPDAFFAIKKQQTDIPHIAVICRLTAEKNVDLILKAAHAMTVPVVVDIVGDGAQRQRLERLAARLQMQQVVFHGYKYGDQLEKIYGSASVVCLMSQNETFGIVLLEAMAAGAVVVAADAPGARDVVADVGVLVKRPTPTALAKELDDLLQNKSHQEALRKAAAKRVSTYRWSDIAASLSTLLSREAA